MGLFDPIMLTYRIGSMLSGSPVLSGILPETVFCRECHRAGRVDLIEWLDQAQLAEILRRQRSRARSTMGCSLDSPAS